MSQTRHLTCDPPHRQEFQEKDIIAAPLQFSDECGTVSTSENKPDSLTDEQKSLINSHINVAIAALTRINIPDPFGTGRSEALYALTRAVLTYDPSRGASLETWIYTSVSWALRYWRRQQSVHASRYVPMPSTPDTSGTETPDTELETAVDDALASESPDVRGAARMLLDGATHAQIADRLQVTEYRASKLIQRAKTVLTAVLVARQ